MTQIGLICDAGVGVGLGHLSRMRVLEKALEAFRNLEVELFVREHTTDEFEALALNDSEVLIFDLHSNSITPRFQNWLIVLKKRGIKIVGIDSLDYAEYCDFIHIPAFAVNLDRLKGIECPVFYGWDAYLLPKINSQDRWKANHKVLVLTGGGDATGLGLKLPGALENNLDSGAEIHWVRGPYAPDPVFPKDSQLVWIKHVAPPNLKELMREAGYAITVYGVSFFELLQQGIPTVVFCPYSDSLKMELKKIKDEEICVVAEDYIAGASELSRLMNDFKSAARLSDAARDRLKISGADQLAQHIGRLSES